MGEDSRQQFLKKCKQAADEFKKNDNYIVVGHIDTDGITSCAIITKALERAGKKVRTKNLKQLYTTDIQNLNMLGDHIILTDFGSAKVKELKEGITGTFYIIDHHQLASEEYEWNINPLNFGVDGGKEICAAGTAYLIAKAMDEKNKDLSELAVIGALGDMQETADGLTGINKEIILKDALEQNVISVKKDLRLYGRYARPLLSFLTFSSDPIIPKITANSTNVVQLLKKCEIKLKDANENWRSYEDLDLDEKKRLISALMMRMINAGEPDWAVKSLVGQVYTLENEKETSILKDAKEYSTVMNACGRHGQPNLGVKVAMGDRTNAYAQAVILRQHHKRILRAGIEHVEKNGLTQGPNYQWFDATDVIIGEVVGIVAGMLYGGGNIDNSKAILAFAKDQDGNTKVSARTTWKLVKQGQNLGAAMTEACKKLGGISEGGGHCLEGNTQVLLADGRIKSIKDIVEKEVLLGYNEGKIHQSKCNKVFSNKKSNLLTVKTDLYTINCSADHRLFKFKDWAVTEVNARNLKPGDFVLALKTNKHKGKSQKISSNPYLYLTPDGLNTLKEKRKEAKLSQTALARKLGKKIHFIHDKEQKASHRYQKKDLEMLLQILKITKKPFLKKYLDKAFKFKTNKQNKEIASLLGYIVGDGYIDNKRLECKDAEKTIIATYEKIIEKYCNATTKLYPVENHFVLRAYSTDFCQFLKENWPELKYKAEYAKVPERILLDKPLIRSSFLRGLFDAEACVFQRYIHITTKSKILMNQVQLMLLDSNILSHIRKVPSQGTYRLEISDYNSLKNYEKYIGFSRKTKKEAKLRAVIKSRSKIVRNSNLYLPATHKELANELITLGITLPSKKKLKLYETSKKVSRPTFEKYILPLIKNKTLSQKLKVLLPKDYLWLRVKKITKKQGKTQLYDLSSLKTKNYIANGLLVHNSIAAGARLEPDKEQEFLQIVGQIFEEQMKK